MSAPSLIVLAAGGTGGHVFPAEALAAVLLARGHRLALVTDRRGGAFKGTLGALETHRIRAGGFAGRGPFTRIVSAVELALGTLQARRLLSRLAPRAVVGFGGYASAPTVLAATLAGLKTVIHEQNAILGRANRLLAARVGRLALSFARTERVPPAAMANAICTGMPVRPAIAAARAIPYSPPTGEGPVRLFVFGGSQGARVFADVVPAALARLPEPVRQRLAVGQQARPEDVERVRHAYAGTGIAAEIAPFFADVPERLAAAHLLIARAGASTAAEIATVGRPAILVPYPFAADDHQRANARALSQAGAAWLVPEPEFTAAALSARLEGLLRDPSALAATAAAARAEGRPEAAERLADAVRALFGDEPERRAA